MTKRRVRKQNIQELRDNMKKSATGITGTVGDKREKRRNN